MKCLDNVQRSCWLDGCVGHPFGDVGTTESWIRSIHDFLGPYHRPYLLIDIWYLTLSPYQKWLLIVIPIGKQQTRLALAIQCLGGGGGVPAAHTVRQGHHRTPLCGRYRLNALSITFQIRFPRWGRALGAPGAAISPLGPMSKKETDSLILCLLKKYKSIWMY